MWAPRHCMDWYIRCRLKTAPFGFIPWFPKAAVSPLMTGDQDILVHRTAELVERTRALFNVSAPRAMGGLVSYCAACAGPLAEARRRNDRLGPRCLGRGALPGWILLRRTRTILAQPQRPCQPDGVIALVRGFPRSVPSGKKMEFILRLFRMTWRWATRSSRLNLMRRTGSTRYCALAWPNWPKRAAVPRYTRRSAIP